MTDLSLSIYVTLLSSISVLIIGLLVWVGGKDKTRGKKISYERQIMEKVEELEGDKKNIEEISGLLDKNDAILEIKVKEEVRELKEMNHTLERMLREREGALRRKTKELEDKIRELNEFNDIFMGREDKMIELKSKIKQLENKLKEK